MTKVPKLFSLLLLITACQSSPKASDSDLWLEEINSPRALEYVKNASSQTLSYLKSSKRYDETYQESAQILNTPDKLLSIKIVNGKVYNFWETENNLKGIWRRTSLTDFKSKNPQWELLLDIGELAKNENKNWTWEGSEINPLDPTRALIRLSDGGSDASEIREFDLLKKEFVPNGFFLPLSKGYMTWKDRDHVFVSPAQTKSQVTESGYPRTVRLLKRGEDILNSPVILEARAQDMNVRASVAHRPEGSYTILRQILNFYEYNTWVINSNGIKVKVPFQDARLYGIFKDKLIIALQSPFEEIKAGSLIALRFDKLLGENPEILPGDCEILFAPTLSTALENVILTKNYLLPVISTNTLPALYRVKESPLKTWTLEQIKITGSPLVSRVIPEEGTDEILIYAQDILTPTQIIHTKLNRQSVKNDTLFELKPFFDAKKYQYSRYETLSEDGTTIPYFVIAPRNLTLNSQNPTLLYGYGGFRISLAPDSYNPLLGKTWLEKGGVYVIANIRGGGEFGPDWHKSAIKMNKIKSYQDFASVARDLTKRHITTKDKLALFGGSNGGLLVGATMVLYPDLAKAIIAEVPLLDMLRYHKLLAGASWMAEYGNPDNQTEADYILRYSPYQNVKQETAYPSMLLITSTRDDRVHPGHARKMYKKMSDQGHEVYLYENSNGGHKRASDLEQKALLNTIKMTFLFEKLKM